MMDSRLGFRGSRQAVGEAALLLLLLLLLLAAWLDLSTCCSRCCPLRGLLVGTGVYHRKAKCGKAC